MKKFVIISASDSNYGGFLINHWLKSLMDNVDLTLVDIAILDYGLNLEQIKKLKENKVKIIPCVRDGHVVNIRYRDMLKFLKNNKYEQILLCDGGDIIFQRDITPFFYKNKKAFKVTFENLKSNFVDYLFARHPFYQEFEEDIYKTLKDKKMINGGFIIGPYEKFNKLCGNMSKLIKNKNLYGPDQVILNYTLYKTGFVELDSSLNYVINNNTGFKVRNGVFLDKNNQIIFVVHNAGGFKFLRSVKNFGHGPGYNIINWPIYFLIRISIKLNIFSIPACFFSLKKKILRT
jgi:hypothetical protein